jgi:hypothetical protein
VTKRSDLLIAAVLSLVSFALYVVMAARDVMFGDGPELTAAAITNTVAHPPGYPLWIVLGHLASLVPLGPPAFRVNLTACAYHAATVGLVYCTAFVLTRRIAPALFAAILLAVGSPLFVSWSLQAEVFSLNDLFAAAIVFLCVAWIEDSRRWMLVIPIAALFGLGLANQQTLLLLAPLPLWAAWCGRDALPRDARAFRAAAAALLLCVAGFALPYAHTLAVSQHLTGWHFGAARTLPELADLIERKAYGGAGLVARAPDQGGNPVERSIAMLSAAPWPFAFAGIGTVVLGLQRRYRELGVAALSIAGPLLGFCALANINVTDEMLRAVFERFTLLPLVAVAPFAACIFGRVKDVVAAVVAGVAATAFAFTLPGLSLANAHGPRTLYTDIFNALPPNTILITAGDAVDQGPPFFQGALGWRPDVTVVTYGLLGYRPYVDALSERISVPAQALLPLPPQTQRDMLVYANRGRPFYTTGERGIHAPGPRYRPEATGVVSRMVDLNAPANLRAQFGEEVKLQTAPGYGDVPPGHWNSNGMAATVREYYAGGFFSTGYDAERLGDRAAARFWYEAAQAYFPDPMIARRIEMLK